MNNMKFNVAFAALLVAGILAMLAGFISRTAIPSHDLAKDAVTVESAQAGGGGGAAAVSMPEPILQLIAAADIERGKNVSKACTVCHSFEKGGPNGTGPGLWGVVGAKKDAHPGYAYSGALMEKGGDTWTYTQLNEFLWKPKAYANDTKMNFLGVKKPEDRAALIAYLRTLADSPKPVPSQAEIDEETARLTPAVAEEAAPAAADGAAPADETADPAAKTESPEKSEPTPEPAPEPAKDEKAAQ